MRKKVILHIGAAKAGSSSIQLFLRRNRTILARFGHVVPDHKLSIGGRVTGTHVGALKAMAKAGDAATFRTCIARVFDASGPRAHAMIVSAENLSTRGNAAIVAGLSAHFDLRVVIYLRRQDELLSSAWQQWNSKVQTDFNAWLPVAMKRYGHWDRVLAEWRHRAGNEAMVVRAFDRSSFVAGDLLRDFVDAIGLSDRAADFDYAQSDVNPSFSDAITAMVAGNRALFSDVHDNRFYNAIGKHADALPPEPTKLSLLTRAQRDQVIRHYRAGNEAVCREYFPGRARLFPPVDHGRFRYVSRDQMVDEKIRVVISLVTSLLRDRAALADDRDVDRALLSATGRLVDR